MPVGPPDAVPGAADADARAPRSHFGSYSVFTARSPSELGAHAAAWDALALSLPQRLPMLGPTWARAFWEHRLAPGDSMWVQLVYDDEPGAGRPLLAVLPVVSRGGAKRCLALPHDDHTKSGDVVLAPGSEPLLGTLVRGLRLDPGRWTSLTLVGVREGSPTLAALETIEDVARVHRGDDERGSYVPIAGTIEELRARLGDNFRRNLKKAGNRLSREAGVAFRFFEGKEASAEQLASFLAIEASGWKGAQGTAIAHDPRLTAFYRALVDGFSALGRLEWHVLEIGGVPAAMHLGVRHGRALCLLKIAYDETFSRLGPGNLLFERLLARELEAGRADEVNCLTDMPWHRNWALPQTSYARITLVRRAFVPWAATWLPMKARAAAKRSRWLRRLFGKPVETPTKPAATDEDAT